jgi:hypothetical protein
MKISGNATKRLDCEELANALDSGGVGDIVAKHEKLILQYYEDVQKQATESFKAAKFVSYIGFAVLILTWLYTLGFDLVGILPGAHIQAGKTTAVSTGVISGVLIEFIAGINFWLYSKASKQFGAFHICLERTHRYLVAYKIAEGTGSRKELVLESLACIMASAPMITSVESHYSLSDKGAHKPPAPQVEPRTDSAN